MSGIEKIHTIQIDTALNEMVRIITGCLKPKPIEIDKLEEQE